MFQQALHRVTWSVWWNVFDFRWETTFTKRRSAFYFCNSRNDRISDKNEILTVEHHFVKIVRGAVAHKFQLKYSTCNSRFTMSSQEPPKKKSKRDNGPFCLYKVCTCVDVMYFVPVCTSAYHVEKCKTWLWTINKSISAKAHPQSLNVYRRKTHLNVPHGGNN